MQFSSIVALTTFVAVQLAFAGNPLPQRTDISADYGGVAICANVEISLDFLRNYHSANKYGGLDTDRYLAGRRATGCHDSDEALEIIEVVERRQIGTEVDGPYIAFRAKSLSGSIVTGVVGEGGNNHHPRTSRDRWLRLHAPDGVVEVANGKVTAFACPTVATARAVVKAIPPVRQRGANNPHQVAAFSAALKRYGCRPAHGIFKIVDVSDAAFISLGYESGQEWTALDAIDARSRQVGLVFDAGLM